jgi:hypothetical protein
MRGSGPNDTPEVRVCSIKFTIQALMVSVVEGDYKLSNLNIVVAVAATMLARLS